MIDASSRPRRGAPAVLSVGRSEPSPTLPTTSRPRSPTSQAPELYEPSYDADEAEFSDLKNEISIASKRALARLKADGFEIKARPDAIIVSRDGTVETLRSNAGILNFAKESES